MASQSTEPILPSLVSRGSDGLKSFDASGAPCYPWMTTGDVVRCFAYNTTGTLFAYCNSKTTLVVRVEDGSVVCELPRAKTSDVVFSPLDTYLATWEVFAVKADQVAQSNVVIWDIKTGKEHMSYINKRMDGWQPQWTGDETLLARLAAGEVQFLPAHNPIDGGIVQRITLPGLSSFKLSPGKAPYKIAVFLAPVKEAPGTVRLFAYPQFVTPLCNKSFFKADQVTITWNNQGTAVLVGSSTDVDKTGQSYYGETCLYYLSATDGLGISITLDKPGPIHDFDWSPNGKEFVVVYGTMPSKAALFNKTCDKVFDFQSGPRNTVKYSPNGNIIALAGFGNLRGDVEIWERKTLTFVSKIIASDSTVFRWGPDSRHILTATTSPRLKVDNGVRVWHYMGRLVHSSATKELLDVIWKPSPAGTYPERPLSPKYTGAEVKAALAKPQAYRPPGARGQPASFKLHDDVAPVLGASALATKKKDTPQPPLVPGADPTPAKKKSSSATPATSKAAPTPIAPPAETAEDLTKRIRATAKKIRQIEEIKEKQAGGATLDPAQIEKVATLDALRAELAVLEASKAALP